MCYVPIPQDSFDNYLTSSVLWTNVEQITSHFKIGYYVMLQLGQNKSIHFTMNLIMYL